MLENGDETLKNRARMNCETPIEMGRLVGKIKTQAELASAWLGCLGRLLRFFNFLLPFFFLFSYTSFHFALNSTITLRPSRYSNSTLIGRARRLRIAFGD